MQHLFDPTSAVRFDLNRGNVSVDDAGLKLLVAIEALLDLCKTAGPEATRAFGHRLGVEAGARAAGRFRTGAEDASLDAVLEHLGGDLALVGIGSIGVERWGRVLVLTVSASALGEEGDALTGAVLEGAVQRSMSRDVSMVRLHRDGDAVRYAALSPATAEKVRGWIRDGVSWGEALARLN